MMRHILLFLCFPLALSAQLTADIQFLHDQIIIVHLDDGYVDYALAGEPLDNDVLFADPINENAASLGNNYLLNSTTDPNYETGVNPIQVSRKSKPTEFTNQCNGWSLLPYYGVWGCDNPTMDHSMEHWIYLRLPNPLSTANSYTLTLDNGIAGQPLEFAFEYDEKEIISEAIHINETGYTNTADRKYAYVYAWAGDGGSVSFATYSQATVHLRRASDDVSVFTGSLSFRKGANNIETLQNNPLETPNQNFLGGEVYEFDFSGFETIGDYYVEIEGIGRSRVFSIGPNVLEAPFSLIMEGLYNNRSGITLSPPNTESLRPAPHNPALTPGFSGMLYYSSTSVCEVDGEANTTADSIVWEQGIQGVLEHTWGWYQDAGDWDAYVSHFSVPAHLLFTFEHFSANFSDGQLSLEENANGIPDILDEARWLIRFYKRIKDETEDKGWTTGGVPGGRVFGDLWGEDLGPNQIVRGSWQDTDRKWVASGEDPITSYYYAAVAAQYQWILETFGYTDPEGIDWTTEATAAFQWAEENSSTNTSCFQYDRNWIRNYASAALYRLTTNETAHQAYRESWDYSTANLDDVLQGTHSFGAYLYAHPQTQDDGSYLQAAQNEIENTADFYLTDFLEERACRWGGNPYSPMLVGQPTTPLVFEGLMAMALLEEVAPGKSAQYRANLYTTIDYFLGTNPLHQVWVTGLSERSPTGILHLDSWATGLGETKAGIVPYGPWLREPLVNVGPWHHMWPDQWVYPDISEWPGHERWFDQRPCPATGEFTIHQNSVVAAAVYGAMMGKSTDVSNLTPAELGESPHCIRISPNPTQEGIYLTSH
ncbi:MAG: glycoside hydrolase family 9 protein, partial [Bacteroidota bacterium]